MANFLKMNSKLRIQAALDVKIEMSKRKVVFIWQKISVDSVLKNQILTVPKRTDRKVSQRSLKLSSLLFWEGERKKWNIISSTHTMYSNTHTHCCLWLGEGTTFFSNWQRIMVPLFPSYKPLPSCLWKIYGINSPNFALLPVTLVVTSHTDSGLGQWEGSKLDASRHLWKHSICLPSSLSTRLHCSAGVFWDTYRGVEWYRGRPTPALSQLSLRDSPGRSAKPNPHQQNSLANS